MCVFDITLSYEVTLKYFQYLIGSDYTYSHTIGLWEDYFMYKLIKILKLIEENYSMGTIVILLLIDPWDSIQTNYHYTPLLKGDYV